MTEIQFYHLLTSPLEKTLPKLLERALTANMRCVVRVSSPQAGKKLDDMLWEHENRFLPHGTAQDAHPDRQPVYITHEDENPNQASVLVITDGLQINDTKHYTKILDLFDGHQESQVAAARLRWKHYKDAGIKLTYNKQQAGGGWKQEQTANA